MNYFSQHLNKHLKSLITNATTYASIPGFTLAFVASNIAVGNNTAQALPVAELGLESVQQLRQVISQVNEPPEVIIDDPNDPNSVPPAPARASSDTRFTCDLVNGEYTVMYYPESQPDQSYPWAIPSELGGGWTPQKRCDAITSRFEAYRQDGLLELSTGVENGYDTICVTTQLDPTDCRLILTVPPGQDPQLTRDLIFDNLLVADDGGSTQGVYTFGDDKSGRDILDEVGKVLGNGSGNNSDANSRPRSPKNINLKPFLDPADGGTGQKLTNSKSAAPAPARPNNGDRKPALFQ